MFHCDARIPSLKLTWPPKKWMVGILVSVWDGLFSGAMLVSGRVMSAAMARVTLR